MGLTFSILLGPAPGIDSERHGDFVKEGAGFYRFQHKVLSRLLFDDRLDGVLSREERALLEPTDLWSEHAPEAVKAALVKASARLAPDLENDAAADWDQMWKLDALMKEVGAAVLLCEHAALPGRRVYVAKT